MYNVELRPLIRLPKSSIRTLIGKQLDYSVPSERIYYIDENSCTKNRNCPLAKRYLELKEYINTEKSKYEPDIAGIKVADEELQNIAKRCSNAGCQYAHFKTIYHNDRRRYNLYRNAYSNKNSLNYSDYHRYDLYRDAFSSVRFPKSVIRTYLFLCSLPMHKLGKVHFINDLSLDIIAEYLDICRETARKCIDILASFNYITVAHASGNNAYHIIISEYDTMHLPAEEGGNGYYTISSSMMEKVLSIKNVNALRLDLLCTLQADDDLLHHKESSHFVIKDLHTVLPSHMAYANRLRYYVADNPGIFVNDVKNKTFSFVLRAGLSLRVNQDEYVSSFKDVISSIVEGLELSLGASDIHNLCLLTREFTINNIEHALNLIKTGYDPSNTDASLSKVKSLGAMVRSICRSSYISIAA